ncbi:MAG: MFS transporter [Acidobacteriota bacterium]
MPSSRTDPVASTPPPAKSSKSLVYEWYVVGALTSLYTLSFIDRTILGLLIGPIKRDLGINDTQVGLLTGLAFSVFYTLVGLPIGRLADTKSRRNLIAAGLVVWCCFTSAGAATKSYATLFLARIGVGVGESSLSPAAYSLIADYFPKRMLGIAISVFYMGVFLGSSLALLLGGIIVQALSKTPTLTLPILGTIASWRATFLLVGLPGFLFVLLVYTIREPQRRGLIQSSTGGTHLPLSETIAQMKLRWQSLVGISVACVFQSMCTFALISWGPQFLQRIHGWNAAEAGRALAGILLIFGCGGMLSGGKLSDYWHKQGVAESPLRVGLISGVGTALFLAPAFAVQNPYWTLALAGPGLFFAALPMGISVAALQRIFPNQVRGQVSAFFLFVLNLGGYPLGTMMPGVFNNYFFHDEMMLGPSMAITIMIGAVLMLVLFAVTIQPYKRHYQIMAAELPVASH